MSNKCRVLMLRIWDILFRSMTLMLVLWINHELHLYTAWTYYMVVDGWTPLRLIINNYIFVLTKGDVMRSTRGLSVFVTSPACNDVCQHCTLNKSWITPVYLITPYYNQEKKFLLRLLESQGIWSRVRESQGILLWLGGTKFQPWFKCTFSSNQMFARIFSPCHTQHFKIKYLP